MSISIGRRMDGTGATLPGMSPLASAATGSSDAGGASPATAGDSATSSSAGAAGSTSGTTGPMGTGSGTTGSSGSAGSAGSPFAGSAGSASTAATGSSGGASSSTSSSSGTGSTTGQDVTGTDTFLKLLVAQMRNQDPSQPMDSQSFVTELAQFNSVEQLLSLKETIATQTTALQETQGIALLGRTVTYAVPGVGSAPSTTNQGVVTGVSIANGTVQLQLGTQPVSLDSVVAVS